MDVESASAKSTVCAAPPSMDVESIPNVEFSAPPGMSQCPHCLKFYGNKGIKSHIKGCSRGKASILPKGQITLCGRIPHYFLFLCR